MLGQEYFWPFVSFCLASLHMALDAGSEMTLVKSAVTRTEVDVLCPAVTMSLTTPGYNVRELESGKCVHTGDNCGSG